MSTAGAAERPDGEAAFEALYRESRDDLYAYVAGLLRDRSAAEEVTSAGVRAGLAQAPPDRSRPRVGPRAWLFGIARNAALDELRRRSRRADMPDGHPRPGRLRRAGRRAPPAATRPRSPCGAPRCARRWTTLNGRDRELVALKYFAGLSNAEIAEVIGTSESNAGTRTPPRRREAEEVVR